MYIMYLSDFCQYFYSFEIFQVPEQNKTHQNGSEPEKNLPSPWEAKCPKRQHREFRFTCNRFNNEKFDLHCMKLNFYESSPKTNLIRSLKKKRENEP